MKCHGEDVFRMDGKIKMVDFYLKIWTTAITKLLKAAIFFLFPKDRQLPKSGIPGLCQTPGSQIR